ncbi:MAG: Ig-like domain-containing protein [Anaerolineae bacterium]|nr:Ig-like domain-containing protein [Anaerolineae bacterium]MDW8171175.1 CARDB domain-containing protein [Anaerolineae bacterium]
MRHHARSIALLAWLAALGMACNLGAPAPTPVPPTSTAPASASRPSVIIQSPANGAQFPVNQTIPLSVVASDDVGVTRVQLFVNDVLVRTVTSQNINGDRTLSAVLDFVPRVSGDQIVRVLAYRGAVASDPAELTLRIGNVATNTPLPAQRPTQPSLPPIPNDGVCRALVNNAANLRSAPRIDPGNIITVMPQFSLVPIVGRLADNSWWRVNFNNQFGWVSAALTTLYGNCGTVPIEGATPTPTPQPVTNTPIIVTVVVTAPPSPTPSPLPRPDLIITSITGPSSIALGGAASVTQNYSVTITNMGLGPARGFNAVLRVNSGAPIDLGTVGELFQGQSITLVRPVTFSGPGNYVLQAEADPSNLVPEVSEVNNIGIINVTVTP